MKKEIIPVLLGADLNCYSVARAFHEAYDVCSYAFGKYAVGETQHSKIVKFTAVPDLEQSEVLCRTLTAFAEEHKEGELYLIACTDEYEEAVIKNRKVLEKYYFCPCPSEELAKKLISKEAFYNMCEQHALPYPKTHVFHKNDDMILLEKLGFDYPIIIKPSSSIEYWRAPFKGMKKVYTAQNTYEAREIISAIYDAGYTNSIILQELILGGEDAMYVLTTYSSQNTKVRTACMGHVLLGE
ncbi:MAG: ATP-grasp domain-containing protein, partial [Clostridia bacterium]|nr:ATP-grasp domain-containing protein [Clostridia bacterium]